VVLLIILAIACICTTVSFASEYRIIDLFGLYEEGLMRVDTLTYDGSAGKIINASLHIIGVGDYGLLWCTITSGDTTTTEYEAPLKSKFFHEDSGIELSTKYMFFHDRFDHVEAYSGADIPINEGDNLIITIHLEGIASYCYHALSARVLILDAYISVEIDTETPIEKTTWGQIKSIYSGGR
jgi:hypothetical protein